MGREEHLKHKQFIFDEFLKKKQAKYFEAEKLLIRLYDFKEKIKDEFHFNLVHPEKIRLYQIDWQYCINSYDGAEFKTFKNTLQIEADEFGHFVDLTKNGFPIIRVEFIWLEPYEYIKVTCVSNLKKFISDLEEGKSLKSYTTSRINEDNKKKDDFFQRRKLLISDGKIEHQGLLINTIFRKNIVADVNVNRVNKGVTLMVKKVSINFVSLLGPQTPIDNLKYKRNKIIVDKFFKKPRNILDINLFIIEDVFRDEHSYLRFTFDDGKGKLIFRNEAVFLTHSNCSFITTFVKSLFLLLTGNAPNIEDDFALNDNLKYRIEPIKTHLQKFENGNTLFRDDYFLSKVDLGYFDYPKLG